MFNSLRKLWAPIGAALVTSAIVAMGAGIYEGYPAAVLPFVGTERFAIDTLIPNGANPQTENVTLAQVAAYSRTAAGSTGDVNSLICGDFGTCPWQRSTAAITGISNTLTYTADRWYALGGASSSITVTKETGATDIFQDYAASLRFQRASSNTDTTAICFGQVLTSADSTRYQGHTAVLSFIDKSGANFSAVNFTATIGYGTSADDTSANFNAGSWAGYTAAVAGSITPTTAFTGPNKVSGAIPLTATQIGVKFCYTPVGTAGTNDWLEFIRIQLEVNDSGNFSSFSHRSVANELALANWWYWQATESSTAIQVRGTCAMSTTSIANCYIPFPRTMRVGPTMTYATGFEASATVASSSATACTNVTTTATLTGNTASPNGVIIDCASSAGFGAAGTAGFIWDVGTGSPAGRIRASADL